MATQWSSFLLMHQGQAGGAKIENGEGTGGLWSKNESAKHVNL